MLPLAVPPPPLIISLPSGLSANGVVAWAVRLTNTLVAQGAKAGLILHAPPPDHAPMIWPLDPRVRLWDVSDLAPLSSTPGRVERFIPRYHAAITAFASHSPVILSPNLHADDYAIAAALSQSLPDQLRVVGWLHNDIPYEYHLQTHYEPLVSAFIPVSTRIDSTLRQRLPASRHADIHRISYGVEVPSRPPSRPALAGRSLRIVYAGRLEEPQKRVMCLPHLSRELTSRGVNHELAIMGDGPAAATLAKACAPLDRIRFLGPRDSNQVRAVLANADVFVLPSRHEGLSVAAMEALAQGCVPVLASVASGAAELVVDAHSGVLVSSSPADEGQPLGITMAGGVCRALAGLPSMSLNAWERASHLFSLSAHAGAVVPLLRELALAPARVWPTTRPCAISADATTPGASGSVPADGAERLTALLCSLKGRRILIHGTGRHTLELAHVFATHGDDIIAFTDDDPARHGSRLWAWPIIAPHDASNPDTNATDVIISSWINQAAILARCDTYHRRNIRVHALYDTDEPEAPARVSPASERK